ncbi:MAG TPA: GNAT family N-acetyltransferase [Candidatus Aquilonibacter sp.]|nr:GNAT family N-acetyltransferase [Candidatus Aquilonibacter sp.]
MPVPDRFSTPRLHARRATADDIEYVYEVDSDPQMFPWLSGTSSTRSESEARLRRWLDEERRSGFGFWLFFDGDTVIGHGGLFTSAREPGSFELGYAIVPKAWGSGYATEMASALMALAKAAHLENVIAVTRRTNERSQRVLEKIGFRYDREVVADGGSYLRYVRV